MERELECLAHQTTDLRRILVWRQDPQGAKSRVSIRPEISRNCDGAGAEAADRLALYRKKDAAPFARPVPKRSAPLRDSLRLSAMTRSWFDIPCLRTPRGDRVCSAIGVNRASGWRNASFAPSRQTLTRTFRRLDAGSRNYSTARAVCVISIRVVGPHGPSGRDVLTADQRSSVCLDAEMRDLGRVPEPRNYSEWRRRMTRTPKIGCPRKGPFLRDLDVAAVRPLRVSGRRPLPTRPSLFKFRGYQRRDHREHALSSMEAHDCRESVLDTPRRSEAVFSPSRYLSQRCQMPAMPSLLGHRSHGASGSRVSLRDASVGLDRAHHASPGPGKKARGFLRQLDRSKSLECGT